MTEEVITHHFPDLTEHQRSQMAALMPLYEDWNSKINIISRKDISNLYEHHVLHSLAIAKLLTFKPGTMVLDVGTGGGFPGIPLAIMFPDVQFHLLDSVGKKIKVAQSVADQLGLRNVTTEQVRVEEHKQKYHFVVSRAVMPLPDLVKLARKNISKEQLNAIPNGIITLKGGQLEQEVKPFGKSIEITPVTDFFKTEYFEGKSVLYLPI